MLFIHFSVVFQLFFSLTSHKISYFIITFISFFLQIQKDNFFIQFFKYYLLTFFSIAFFFWLTLWYLFHLFINGNNFYRLMFIKFSPLQFRKEHSICAPSIILSYILIFPLFPACLLIIYSVWVFCPLPYTLNMSEKSAKYLTLLPPSDLWLRMPFGHGKKPEFNTFRIPLKIVNVEIHKGTCKNTPKTSL